jgi:hypothetical protein
MVILVSAAQQWMRATEASEPTIADLAHSSPPFVMERFLPVLEELDTVVRVRSPAAQVDALFELCRALGRPCVFLSFAPPHLTPLGLRCRTIPVFS